MKATPKSRWRLLTYNNINEIRLFSYKNSLDNIAAIKAGLPVFQISVRSEEGIEDLIEWIVKTEWEGKCV